jgi:Tol biopolymer transport system component
MREFRVDLTNPVIARFSPDSQRLLVAGSTRLSKAAAYVVDLSTGNQISVAVADTGEQLWAPAVETTAPEWGPGRDRVYFRRITKAGARLFEHDLAAGTARELFSTVDPGGNTALSPDARKVYYRRLLGPSERLTDMQEAAFVERDLATGSDREVTRRFSLGAIGLSPDGRYIVTGSVDPSGKSRSLLLISVADGQTREILSAPRDKTNPIAPIQWAPDSRSILIRRMPPGAERTEVWWAPVDGRPARQMMTMATLGRVRIHPDGRQIVFSGGEAPPTSDELWLLDGFLPQGTLAGRGRPQ